MHLQPTEMKAIGMNAGIKMKAKRLKPNKEETYETTYNFHEVCVGTLKLSGPKCLKRCFFRQ